MAAGSSAGQDAQPAHDRRPDHVVPRGGAGEDFCQAGSRLHPQAGGQFRRAKVAVDGQDAARDALGQRRGQPGDGGGLFLAGAGTGEHQRRIGRRQLRHDGAGQRAIGIGRCDGFGRRRRG